MLKGNKGEWSELYVFTKLLAEGKLYQSDLNLNIEKDNYYEVLKAYREEPKNHLEYTRKNNGIQVSEIGNGNQLVNLPIEYFSNNAVKIFNGIKEGKGKSFAIENVDEFMQSLHINKLKAPSSSKADLKLKIYDYRLAKETDLGFSIKSLLGKTSTLLNTGAGNNFIYDIYGEENIDIINFNKDTYKPIKGSKIGVRLQSLIDKGFNIKFKEIQSKQFWRNLKMVDGDLPEILSYALLYAHLYKDKSLIKISQRLETNDPLNFYDGDKSSQKLYEYKIKKLLAECAMGMTSEKVWEGVYDATGGVIIAKKDGDVVCFHIYDFNLFREYLINNTKLEQPSTGEDEENPGFERKTKGTKNYYYGWLYNNTSLNFKINLQIRFK